MKKKIVILLIVCLLGMIFVGCGNNDTATDEDTSTDVVTEETTETDESADIVELLDEYEDFVDEYVEFMEEYNNGGDTSDLLSEYSDMLSEYSDWASKIDDIDTSSLSSDDYDYYLEVTERCLEKITDAGL